jgi:hypothetical protein
MHFEAFRLWSLLRKGSVFCVIFLVASLTLEIQTYLAASATRDVALVWSQPPELDVAGYNVYYGPVSRYENSFDEYLYAENLQPGDYQEQDPEVHYVLASIDENLSYWVAITAYDHQGNESAYSNEKKVGTASSVATTTASSGGCQTAPASMKSKVDSRAAVTGWIFFCLVVPAWILRLRKKLPHSDAISV